MKPGISLKALDTLWSMKILDTPQEAQFQAVVQVAAAVCKTPISLISLLDVDRQWFKANVGLEGVTETPRDVSFCAHSVEQDGILLVPDASQDARFSDNPLVTGDPGIRFYAGMPLAMSNGAKIGTLCVIDRQPRQLDEEQQRLLAELARTAAKLLESGISSASAMEAVRLGMRVESILANVSDAVISISPDGIIKDWNPAAEEVFGYASSDAVGKHSSILIPERLRDRERLAFQRLVEDGMKHYETLRVHASGQEFPVAVTLAAEADLQGNICAVTKFVRRRP